MKMSMRFMVVACFAGCATVASGVVEFADKTQSGTRDFWDASVWREAGAPTLPRDGAAVQVASYARDLTLVVTGDVSIAMTDLMVKCGNRQAASGTGNRLTFDGDGHVFGVPDGKATYGNPPLRFEVYRDDLAKEACFLFCERGKDTTSGTYRWTDPVFTLEADSAYRANLTFQKGVYDFFMPNGATNAGSVVIGDTAAASNPFSVTSTVAFASGTCLKASALRVSRIGNDNASVALAFDGATLNVAETYTQCGGCVTLTNGAVATAGTTTLNGGTLLVSGPETRVETGRLWIEAGATVSLADEGRLTLGTASGPTLVGRGMGGIGVLRLLGGVFDTSGQAVSVGASGPGKIVVSGGDHRFSGGDNFIGQGCDAEVLVEGGRLYMTRVRMGQGAEGTALFRQTGGVVETATGARDQTGILLGFATQPCAVWLEGGETHCSRLRYRYTPGQDSGYSASAAATMTFLGNGGTLVPIQESTVDSPFMAYLGVAQIGARGLTLDNRNGVDVYILQDLVDADEESGEWRLRGRGTVSYEGVCRVARTVLNGGTLKLATAASRLETALSVGRGACLSLAGAATATSLKALTIRGGTIELDPGDVISVEGDVAIEGLTLDWTTPPAEPTAFLVVKGALDEATRQAILNAGVGLSLGSGRHLDYAFERDESTGRVTVKAQAVDDAPLSETAETVWKGARDALWHDSSNWVPQLPSENLRAVFGGAAQKSVAVSEAAVAGALRFDGGDTVIGGSGSIRLPRDPSASRIDVRGGVHRINVPVELSRKTAVDVTAGASLELSGGVTGGGLAKGGDGALLLSGPSHFYADFSSVAGLVTIRDAGALDGSSASGVTVSGGTVAFEADKPVHLNGRPVLVDACSDGSVSTTVVFRTESDVEIDALEVKRGTFFKRGAGTLTLNVPDGETQVFAGEAGLPNSDISGSGPDGPWTFPADGSSPTGVAVRRGINVSEGKLVLRAAGADAKVTVSSSMLVGGPSRECAVQPELVLEGVSLTVNGGGFWNGSCVGLKYNAVSNPVVRLEKGAELRCGAVVQTGYGSVSESARMTHVATGGSVFRYANGTCLSRANGGTVEYVLTDSRLLADGPLLINGGIRLDFANSFFGAATGDSVALSLTEAGRPFGELFFHDGSVFACSALTEKSGDTVSKNLTVAFDGAEWRPCRDNAADWRLSAPLSERIVYEMRGEGVVFAPAAGCAYEIGATLGGSGGLVKRGDGIVRFAEGAFAFAGVCRVESGVVDLASAGRLAAATFAGRGTVRGARVGKCTVRLDVDDAGVGLAGPSFDGCDVGDRLCVDLGRDETRPLPEGALTRLKIGRWTGEGTPPPTRVRVIGTGGAILSGPVSVEDGDLCAEIGRSGMVFVVR